MFSSFPKIFRVGDRYINRLLEQEVEVTEKVDGSQFGFGRVDGELLLRSKGQQLYVDAPEAMFRAGIDYVASISDRIPDNTIFYGEFLNKPKHNTLAYDRTPRNGIALFGVCDRDYAFEPEYGKLAEWADALDVDVVPLLYCGKIVAADDLLALMDTDSYLGGAKVEGVVVKNYSEPIMIGGQVIPMACGKYVSEAFKEVHLKGWKGEHTGKGKWETFVDGFRTEARWRKAVQHLAEAGNLQSAPQDIGFLVKEVKQDIIDEEREQIKDFLWEQFGAEVLRRSVAGLPEWYKEQLLREAFVA